MDFKDLNLNKSLWNALDDLGISTPTKIQEDTFSTIMSGRDLVGIAQTGTGKTFAFLLPLLRMWKFSKDRFAQILILVPTRELVVQLTEEIEKLTKYMNVKTVGVYGEANIRKQAAEIELGLDILVGTPGRVFDHIMKGAFKTKNVKKLVIDEVDEMLDLGFRPQLTRIFDLLPERRQNLLFSATMTEDVNALLDTFFQSPITVEAAPSGTPLEKISQSGYKAPNFHSKANLLLHLLEDSQMEKVMIFLSTKKKADLLFDILNEKFPEQIGVIHSNKSQNFRFNSLNGFASGELRILVATDLVSRGLDISEVSHVINYDIPELPESYMHRVGRTGRAEKKGIAISFIKPQEEKQFAEIEALMDHQVEIHELPEGIEFSDVLIDEEMPNYKMRNILTKGIAAEKTGDAFHEKKAKNQKVNVRKTLKDIRAAKALKQKRKRSSKKRKRK